MPIANSATNSLADTTHRLDEQLLKGDAVVVYAEALKEIDRLRDLGDYSGAIALCEATREKVAAAAAQLLDSELYEIEGLLTQYLSVLSFR